MARNNETTVTFKVFNQEFNKAMKEMKDESSKLKQEFKLQEEQMKLNGTQSEKLSAKLQYLQKEHDLAKRQVQETEKQLQKAKDMYGENSEEVDTLSRKLTNARITEQKFANQVEITSRSIDEHEKSLKTLNHFFEVTESSVEDFSHVLGDRLVRSIRDGTATSRDLEDAFKRVARESLGAEGDIDRFRRSLQSLDSGGSLQEVRRDLQQIQSEAEEAEKSVDGLGSALEGAAGVLVAGLGLSAAVDQALESASLDTKIKVSFDVPESSRKSVESAIRGVTAYGVDVEEAAEGARRQWALNKNATDAANEAIIKQAGVIAASFAQVDFNELIQEGNEIGAALKISNDQAMELVNSLLKAGFPPEQLDTIAEYGQQMKDIGFNTAEIQSIFEAGINTKSWNIDNLNDGVKEGRLQMATFGQEVPKSLAGLLKGTDVSKKKMQEWGKAVAEGGEGGSKAMADMAEWLNGIEDKTLKNSLASEIFKTKWEDQGDNLLSVFMGLGDAIDQTDENAKKLDDQMEALDEDPTVKMRDAMQKLKESMGDTLAIIADVVSNIANWVSENPKLASTLVIIATGIGILMGTITALAPIIYAIQTALPLLGAAFTAISWPIVAIIAGIAALIAIGVLLYKNWDEISAWGKKTWGDFSDWISDLWSKFMDWGKEKWSSFTKWLSDLWSSVVDWGKEKWGDFKNWLSEIWTSTVDWGKETWSSFKTWLSETWDKMVKFVIEKALTMANSVITKFTNLKDGAIDKFTQFKNKVESIMQTIARFLSSILFKIKDGFVNTVEKLRSGAVNVFLALRDKTSDIMQSTKDKIIDPIRTAKSKVEGIVGDIKGFFTKLKLKIPTPSLPKLPKFSLEMGSKTILGKEISYPKGFNVKWNAKGAYFDKPVVFNSAYGLQGFGEAGGEIAMPAEGKHMFPFADAVTSRILSKLPAMAESKMTESTNNNTVNIYATVKNEKDMDKMFDKADKWLNNKADRNAAAWGGNG